nr:NAD(P)H-hydrate epimerase [Marinicella sp. W31]MDC2877186.1 NAD(P)H-hydrate epimerase [Marinicella sp. W31]
MLLLTPEEMGRADTLAAASGIDSYGLMEQAGCAVSAAFLRLFPEAARAVVFCGPGNNGGDGYVAARALSAAGVPVMLHHFGDPDRLGGDAARARAECKMESRPLRQYQRQPGDVIIDALFGAGLQRPLSDDVAALTEAVAEAAIPVISVDLPSGISGLSGQVLGAAFRATHTVTFMRAKPGHYLLPGRKHCGHLEVFDIGIPQRMLAEAGGIHSLNTPAIFGGNLPVLSADAHKFRRGHLGVFSGGPSATGAARLSAVAGLKTGAGLVTLAVPSNAALVAATHVTAVMIKSISDVATLDDWLNDKRLSAFVLGPGFGIGKRRGHSCQPLSHGRWCWMPMGSHPLRKIPMSCSAFWEAVSHIAC